MSLRSRMILIIGSVVLIVSIILVYLSTNMIYQDKKAYIYDNAFSSLETSDSTIKEFNRSKENNIKIYSLTSESDEEIKKYYSLDKDLYQVITLTPEEAKSYTNENSEDLNDPNSDRIDSHINDWDVETFLIKTNRFKHQYVNHGFFGQYKSRKSFLMISNNFLAEQAVKAVGAPSTIIRSIYYKKKRAPRMLLTIYNPSKGLIYTYDYFIDNLLLDILNKFSFDVFLIREDGKTVFHNKPENKKDGQDRFFQKFVTSLKTDNKKISSGVREVSIGDTSYILGYKNLEYFPNFYLFSGVKTSEAYEVTYLLVLNTLIYTLCLIAFFNIFSIFLVKTITGPLDNLIKVIQNISKGDYTSRVTQQSTDELQLLGESFNMMVVKIQEYHEKLKEYNRTLEQKVLERTEKLRQANNFIKTMLDSLAQGLVVFNKEAQCLELFTKASENLLGENPANKDLASLLKVPDSDIFKEWVVNLYEEMIPFESLLELGPKSIKSPLHYKHRDFKHITLEFFPMRNEQEKIDNVVMVATDRTKEFRAGKEIEEQKNYVKLVNKVIKDKNNFLRFIGLFHDSLKNEAEQYDQANTDKKNDFMRLLHSMKGSSAFYSMQDIVEALHQFETDVSQGQLDREQVIKTSEDILNKLNLTMNKLKDFLGDKPLQIIEVKEEDLRNFSQILSRSNPEMTKEFSNLFLEKPVENYITQYKDLVQELASKLGKNINPLKIQNGFIKVDMNYFQSFFDSCIHLFRNAVDHAIEKPEVRFEAGKNQTGTITVSFDLIESGKGFLLLFNVQDDGAGIDPARIRKKLTELNYPKEILEKSDRDIIYHIFDPSFSTAENVTDLSGRGIGLFDIKENLEKIGGFIELESKLGKGTIFSFTIPLP